MLKDQFGRLSYLKNNMLFMWDKLSENKFETVRNSFSNAVEKLARVRDKKIKPEDIRIDNYHYESHRADDLPPAFLRDESPGVKYSYTENSEFARYAEKTEAIGIDKFGEEDTFDPDEADEHQDYRNRNQNSDLSQRFFTNGMDISDKDLHH